MIAVLILCVAFLAAAGSGGAALACVGFAAALALCSPVTWGILGGLLALLLDDDA